MKKRSLILSLLLLGILFLVFIIRRWNEPIRKEAFNRDPTSLIYTKHALCRMGCRGIDKEEVREIMEKGIIHFNRSNRRERPCPTFALQGRTSSGEKLRVVFAQCPTETRVVDCYNLAEESECQCPRDPETGSGQTEKKNI